jgi:hypothetical protein
MTEEEANLNRSREAAEEHENPLDNTTNEKAAQ